MKFFFIILKVAISLVFLYFAINVVKLDDISSNLLNINNYWLFLAIIFNLIAIILSGIRWHLINLKLKLNIPLKSCIKINFSGTFLSQFIIGGGYGGDVYRFFLLTNITRKKKKSVISLLVDRGSGLLSTLCIIFFVYPFYFFIVSNDLDYRFINILIFLILIFIIVVMFFYRYSFFHKTTINIIEKLKLKFIYDDFLIWFFKLEHLLTHLNISIFIQLTLILSFLFIGLSINYQMPIIFYFIFFPFIFLAKAIPISFAGWGSREVATIYLFGSIGGDLSGAATISIISGFLLIISSIPGLWFLAYSLFNHESKYL